MKPTSIDRLLRLYPARWRARYGDEYAALLETQPTTASVVLDVLAGAVVAHIRTIVSLGSGAHLGDALRQWEGVSGGEYRVPAVSRDHPLDVIVRSNRRGLPSNGCDRGR